MASQTSLPGSQGLLRAEHPGQLVFDGCEPARLFAQEVRHSLEGVLTTTFTSQPGGRFPVGFVQASVEPRYWWETMWTRDAGTFLRELVHFGYLRHACLSAACLMEMVEHNDEGYLSYPRYFKYHQHAWGAELDGTGAIVIALVLLWEHLAGDHPLRARLYEFLHAADSPVRYMAHRVAAGPLIAGSGEFGGGCFIEGDYCNVVQNGLARLALLAAARFEDQAGQADDAQVYRQAADKLATNMLRHLVGPDGAWLWCVVPRTLQPDAAVLNHEINRGFGGINGVFCMQADVLGPDAARWGWPDGQEACRKTFEKLLNTPLRRRLLDQHGIWTQFDVYAKGLATSPSYGHAYAIQTMLLMDRLDLAAKALNWLAEQTYRPLEGYHLDRDSPYHFYEAMFAPEAAGQLKLKQGAGALNLVNVAEPLKAARLILGIDDSSPAELRIVPHLPDGWEVAQALNWPVQTTGQEGDGLARIGLTLRRRDGGLEMELTCRGGGPLPAVAVRRPADTGGGCREYRVFPNVTHAHAML